MFDPNCVHCGKPAVADSSSPLLAVAVPSDETGAEHLHDVRTALGLHGLAPRGPVLDFAELEAAVAAESTGSAPLALITDEDSSIIVDGRIVVDVRNILARAGELLTKAREDERIATAAAKTALRFAISQGANEKEAARLLDVTRATVRDWLGK